MQDLLESESVLESTSCSRALFLKAYLLAFFLAVAGLYLRRLGPELLRGAWKPFYFYLLVGLAVIIFAINEIRSRSEKLYVTDRRVIFEKGILNKSYESLPYTRISDTVIKKRMGQRLFGLSDLVIDTPGIQLRELRVKGLPDAGDIQNVIEERLETASGEKKGSSGQQDISQGFGGQSGIKTGYSPQQNKGQAGAHNRTSQPTETNPTQPSKRQAENNVSNQPISEKEMSSQERQRTINNLEVELYRVKSRLRELEQDYKSYNLEKSKYEMMKDSLEEREQSIESKLNKLRS